MTRRRCVQIVLSLWTLTSACGSDPHEPGMGALELTVSTTGHDLDPDGYSVTVDAGSPLAVPTNGSASIPDLAAGVHTVTLAGLAGNCAVTTPAPLEFTVPGEAGAVANVEITCTAIYTLAYRGESGLELTDAAGTVTPRTLILEADPLAWSPDGRVLAATNLIEATRVWLASPDDGDGARRPLSAAGERISTDHYVGVWSPDGRELLLETVRRSHTSSVGLARYPLDESYPPEGVFSVSWDLFGEGVPREVGLRGFTWPDWSPDGSQIVFHDLKQTFILSRDGVTQRLLADGIQPDWSPDGNQIVYVASVAGHATLRLINPDGGDDQPLTAPATDETDTDPAWSPDGSTVAFVRRGSLPIVASPRSTGTWSTGTEPMSAKWPCCQSRGFHPTWSADGLHLAYSGGGGTYVVNVDGSGFRLVSTPLYSACAVAALRAGAAPGGARTRRRVGCAMRLWLYRDRAARRLRFTMLMREPGSAGPVKEPSLMATRLNESPTPLTAIFSSRALAGAGNTPQQNPPNPAVHTSKRSGSVALVQVTVTESAGEKTVPGAGAVRTGASGTSPFASTVSPPALAVRWNVDPTGAGNSNAP